jgi:hypothetical protein
MSELIELTEDEWLLQFKPIQNHLDSNASWGGKIFETYGDEESFVYDKDDTFVWTYMEDSEGGTFLTNGRAFINRLGYFVSDVPWNEGETFQVQISFPEYQCPNCGDWYEKDEAIMHIEHFFDLDKCKSCATIEEIRTIDKEIKNEGN